MWNRKNKLIGSTHCGILTMKQLKLMNYFLKQYLCMDTSQKYKVK